MATTTLDVREASGASTTAEAPSLRDTSVFERIYHGADRRVERVPWALDEPHPALIAWLNSEGPCHVRPGCRVAVVGCGLGNDAVEFLNRGFDVTAFDCSPSAVEWARRRHPRHADSFVCADVRSAPSRWRHRFDLVVDVNNVPWIAEEERAAYLGGVVDLLHPNGAMLMICAGAEEPASMDDNPSNPLTSQELLHLLCRFGLTPSRDLDDFSDDHDPPRRWLRGCFRLSGE